MRNPLFDTTLPVEERLDWLLREMTMDEKLRCFATTTPAIERLGIPGFSVGGEAAHGVVNRNDQNGSGKPDITTSFVQPIGMSATWDPELIREAGEVTGTEARVVFHRHPHGGLSRWAPTVDLERDPRWGRNEESYGEDPLLTGVMASAYIQGMQGDNPEHHLRIAATLKHFYANNVEVGRGHKSSSIDPRNRYELYLEPFRRCICDGHAEAVMTAYNKINGIPGMLNPEVRDILKGQYGLHHAVCDGGAMDLCTHMHHYFGTNAETLAASVKAGVDAFPDKVDAVEKAAREAYELGLLTRAEIDGALRNVFRTRLRLGLFDQENPYDNVTEADIDSPSHRALSRKVAQESIVLLKNENHTLPLQKESVGSIALIGPLADTWDPDWYGGMPPYRTTLREGLERELGIAGVSFTSCSGEIPDKPAEHGIGTADTSVGSGNKLLYCDGYDRVIFRYSGSHLTDCSTKEDSAVFDSGNTDTIVPEGDSIGLSVSNDDNPITAVPDGGSIGLAVPNDDSPITAVPDGNSIGLAVLNDDNPITAVPDGNSIGLAVSNNDNPIIAVSNGNSIGLAVSNDDNPITAISDGNSIGLAVPNDDNPITAVPDGNSIGLAVPNEADRIAGGSGDRGMGVTVSDDGSLLLTEHPDIFILQDWGEGSFLLRCERSGKYWNLALPTAPPAEDASKQTSFPVKADSDSPFDWLVTELIHLHDAGNGRITLTTRMDAPVCVNGDGALISQPGGTAAEFLMETVSSGKEQACAFAQSCDTVILALGCNPVINAKEEVDRSTIALPPAQEALMKRVYEVNPNVILALFSNYPYSICWAQEHVPAIIWSATGSQDMGAAMSDVLFGKASPAGRLNMSWYRSDEQLPDIDDYDIIKGGRTYRYFQGEVLYPFGHGLTYTYFAYSNLSVELTGTPAEYGASVSFPKDVSDRDSHPADFSKLSGTAVACKENSPCRPAEASECDADSYGRSDVILTTENHIRVSFDLTNTGDTASDEVAQVYGKAPLSRVRKPLRQLLGFRRIKNVLPGETRQVELLIPVEELRFYDVISETLMVEEGEYQIFAGRSSQDLPLRAALWIPGERTGHRKLNEGRHKADHYDDYENIVLTEGHFGYTAVTPKCVQSAQLLQEHNTAAPKDGLSSGAFAGHTPAASKTTPAAGVLLYRDCELSEDTRALWLHMKSWHGCSVEILIDGRQAGSWSGDTRAYVPNPRFPLDERTRREEALIRSNSHAVYTDVRIPLDLPPVRPAALPEGPDKHEKELSRQTALQPESTKSPDNRPSSHRLCTLEIRISGEIQLCFFRAE